MIHNISDVDLWELGTTTAELQNRTWEQLKYNSNSRIRTKNLFPCSSSLKVKISSNYNIDLLWFNEEGLMISEIETNWLSGNNNEFISISVPNDAKQVGILVKFTDNSDISPSEILNTNIYYDDGLLPNNSIIAENIIDIIIGGTSALKMYIGNELIWIKQQNQGLPSGYTELEYISSTANGGQYIETGLKMWTTTPVSYELDMKVYMSGVGKDNTIYPTIFGNNREVSPYPGFVIRNDKGNTTVTQDLFPKETYGGNNTIVVINQLTENIIITTHDVTATLFCSKDENGVPWRYANCRIYYCKIRSNSDTWQRDFVPCLNPDGIAGLYDKVEGKFYSSPNGVAFEYGEITQ